jgi:hypothetical protein
MAGRRRGNPNWGAVNRGQLIIPVQKTGWEKFIAEIGIQEHETLRVLSSRNEKSASIRSWVNANCRSSFVPEPVLEMLGIEVVVTD